ncbi:MAG: hypothetical protein NTY23_11900 [Chloroflexi bacterium]|nr:hypothetical protein [Chloroflexota bacterium]
MTDSTLSFTVSGHDKISGRDMRIKVKMIPVRTFKDERGLVVTYRVKAKEVK